MRWRAALRPLYLSFWSAPFYREVARDPGGGYLGYLFFVVVLGAIPGMAGGYAVISEFFGKELPSVIRQVPTIRIAGGKASIDPPGPHVVVDPSDNVPLMVFDTSGRTVSLDNTKASFLLTADRMIVRVNPKETAVLETAKLEDGVVDEAFLESFRVSAWNWITLIYFPVAAGLSYLFRLVQTLLFATVALLLARRVRLPLGYTDALRLTVFASTPAIAVAALRDALRLASPAGTVVDILLVLGYVHFAVRAAASPGGGEFSARV